MSALKAFPAFRVEQVSHRGNGNSQRTLTRLERETSVLSGKHLRSTHCSGSSLLMHGWISEDCINLLGLNTWVDFDLDFYSGGISPWRTSRSRLSSGPFELDLDFLAGPLAISRSDVLSRALRTGGSWCMLHYKDELCRVCPWWGLALLDVYHSHFENCVYIQVIASCLIWLNCSLYFVVILN